MGELTGKVAVVTGASRGIGRAIAMRLASAGARVVLAARKREPLEAAAEGIRKAGGEVMAFPVDVTNPAQVEAMVRGALDRFGRIDILVNNAGIGVFGEIVEFAPSNWRRTIDTNLTGIFHCVRAVLGRMYDAGEGHIVNIASLAGKNGIAGGVAYCASKFGVIGFSRALMLEARKHGVRVSVVCPGSVDTGFAEGETGVEWKLQPDDVAEGVLAILRHRRGALSSELDMRPSFPPSK
jgi:NAD(P)-dependent dehydrogenase (short-subunit alcohol dehydrogenase family)